MLSVTREYWISGVINVLSTWICYKWIWISCYPIMNQSILNTKMLQVNIDFPLLILFSLSYKSALSLFTTQLMTWLVLRADVTTYCTWYYKGLLESIIVVLFPFLPILHRYHHELIVLYLLLQAFSIGSNIVSARSREVLFSNKCGKLWINPNTGSFIPVLDAIQLTGRHFPLQRNPKNSYSIFIRTEHAQKKIICYAD